ncbi:MAG: protoheme IX farnesyltransferase [Rhodospirillales bacterium]|nr:protoheme IX farnesyltransferase [Rhodospirillales bacterium]
MKSEIALLYNVFKIRIGMAIMMSALAGLAVTPGASLSTWEITILALAVLGSSAAAGAFNHVIERDLDAQMTRTRNRPFVTGHFKAGPAWYLGITGLLAISVGAAAYVLNGMVALYVFLGAFVYGVVYTVWLKRKTVWNIVVGGLSGSFAVLAGAAAVDPGLSVPAVILAVVLFLWTPPHFWSLAAALREDYGKAGVPMLPLVVGDKVAARIILAHTVLLVGLAMVPTLYGLGWFYWAGAAVGGSYFLYHSLQYVRDPSPKKAMKNFFASLVQLGVLVLGALIGAMTGL